MYTTCWGRALRHWWTENWGPGAHQVEWRADGVASGLYFYRVEFGGTAQVRQMMLVR